MHENIPSGLPLEASLRWSETGHCTCAFEEKFVFSTVGQKKK